MKMAFTLVFVAIVMFLGTTVGQSGDEINNEDLGACGHANCEGAECMPKERCDKFFEETKCSCHEPLVCCKRLPAVGIIPPPHPDPPVPPCGVCGGECFETFCPFSFHVSKCNCGNGMVCCEKNRRIPHVPIPEDELKK
ncbi:uncharacterized protein LOC144440504 isoform X2 [Glandiceps talaboti]